MAVIAVLPLGKGNIPLLDACPTPYPTPTGISIPPRPPQVPTFSDEESDDSQLDSDLEEFMSTVRRGGGLRRSISHIHSEDAEGESRPSKCTRWQVVGEDDETEDWA